MTYITQSNDLPSPIIWVLADQRAGNRSQLFGVADALSTPYITKEVHYNWWVGLPNVMRGKSSLGVSPQTLSDVKPPWPDIILGAGRRVFPLARYIKEMAEGKSKIIQLMWPGHGAKDADFIVVPAHDNKVITDKMMEVVTTPHNLTSDILAKAKAEWAGEFVQFPSPYIGVIIGGDTKYHAFTKDHAQHLFMSILALKKQSGGSLLVTTSRRTSTDICAWFKEQLESVPAYFYDAHSDLPNPYRGIMAIADMFVVTGDSMSMCSEAISVGKPVYLFAPQDATADKHKRFHEALISQSLVTPLTGELQNVTSQPMNSAHAIAQEISQRFLQLS